jgi:tRNA/tmRNA/rRNA uracil-C5-methylase (TrmA/RlmC/RlmD family)
VPGSLSQRASLAHLPSAATSFRSGVGSPAAYPRPPGGKATGLTDLDRFAKSSSASESSGSRRAIIPSVDPTVETRQVQVSAMTFGPCAIARVGGKSVMIPGAVPGDLLEIETRSDKRDYALGSIVRVLQAGPERREPPCPYVSRCGGCDWQHIRYEAQTGLKAQVLAAAFRHTIGIELNPDGLVEPAQAEFGYRSRVRLKTGPAGKIGFHHPRDNSFVAV